jgi:hypothetical protein
MLTKRLEDIGLTDIEVLKDNGVAEGHFIDFKATGVGSSHDERREFNWLSLALPKLAKVKLSASGYNYQYTHEGYVTYSGQERASEAVQAYTLMFRTGAVESAATVAYENERGERVLSLISIENSMIESWKHYLAFANNFGVEAPFYVFLSVLNVKGFEPAVSPSISVSSVPSRRDAILFSEIEVGADRLAEAPIVIFKRLFDTLANAFGLPRSLNQIIPR